MKGLFLLKSINQRWWYLALALGILLLPWFVSNYWISVAVFFGIYALLGLSLNVILGYAGLFQLGHAAFWAVGAYTTAILNTRYGIPILITLPISALVSALFAILITKPILHLRGDYLCLVTIGFGEIVRLFLFNDPFGITGGINGIRGIDRPNIFGFILHQPIHYYYLTMAFVAFTILAMRRLENSRLGRAWVYVREDELAAETMGIDTTQVKLLAFIIGAAWAGVAGTLYASRYTVIAPETFSFWNSCVIFCIVIIGGVGSIPGVLVGTLGMIVLPELLRDVLEAVVQWRMLVFGAAMVLMMIFRPEGFWPSPIRRHELRAAGSTTSE